jgi:diguanylate cyclase (GGDEF)-like protein/PAS domain S-box-containing protein
MRQELELLQGIINGSPNIVYVRGIHGNLILVNKAASRLFGMAADELVGTPGPVIHFESTAFSAREDLRIFGEKKDAINLEAKFLPIEGDPKWFEINKSLIQSDKEQPDKVLIVASDITQKKLKEAHLVQLAMFDNLTKLPNLYLLKDRLNLSIAQATREKTMIGVAYLSLYQLHEVTKTLGRKVSDDVLHTAAQRFLGDVRQSDTVAYLGNNNFVFLLIGLKDIDNILVVARKIFQSLKQPFKVGTHELYIDACLGYNIFPEDATDGQTLLKNSENALVFANLTGGNSIRRFETSMNNAALEKLELTNRLRRAIDQNEFVLYYQPQVNMSDGKVAGLEALIRWNHPEKGIISPNEFIPLAEESGLINSIGDWVLKEVCSQLHIWNEMGFEPPPISVNTSPNQYAQSDFIPRVVEILERFDTDANDIVIEVTEGIFMNEVDKTSKLLDMLRHMGMVVHVDDFGTAYSSLSRLRSLPVDCLKIDKSFIHEMSLLEFEGKKEPAALVRAIITLGHSLGLVVLAEGVETREELETLRNLGCDLVQGYFHSRPVPSDQVISLIQAINA